MPLCIWRETQGYAPASCWTHILNRTGSSSKSAGWHTRIEAGAQFAVTQPVYDETGARILYDATKHLGIPLILGILPLRSARHASFLHNKVAGIAVPQRVQERMALAADPVAEGAAGAREMLDIARQWFAGACIMPPFDHYDLLFDILGD